MTDRRKMRRLRRSALDVSDQLVRRVITDPGEKADTAVQMKEEAQRIASEKKADKEALLAKRELLERDAMPARESESAWTPPESVQDFERSISLAHPDWPLVHTRRMAAMMFDRMQLTRAAIVAGLKIGRELREKARYGKGWWWDELTPLSPDERGQVIDQVRRVVMT